MKYKIEPEGLSYTIYRKRRWYSKWDNIARTSPFFKEWDMRDIEPKDFLELRNRALGHLDQIKEMDKILVNKFND